MATITRWILRHRLLVAAFWIVVAVAGLASSGSATKALSQQFSVPPGYEGVDTNDAILRTYGTGGGAAPLVPVITLPRGTTVATPGIKAQLAAAFAAVQAALPRRARRLLRLDRRPRLRLGRRAHHLCPGLPVRRRRRRRRRRRVQPIQRALARASHRGGAGPRHRPRRAGLVEQRRQHAGRAGRDADRRPGRAAHPDLRLRLVPGRRAAADGAASPSPPPSCWSGA